MNNFTKVWGVPMLLSFLTIAGFLLAIIGTGIWHWLSWMTLSIPVITMVKYGPKFFQTK